MPATMTLAGLLTYDPDLFEYMEVPDGLDPEILTDTIYLRCMPLEVLYPDPVFMKKAITVWSKECQRVWTHLYETLNYEYNPIWNKDGTYTEERDRTNKAETESVGQVVGFNSADFTNANRATSDGSGEEKEKIIRKEQGNIGVTTTQQMILEEREVAEFNIYEYIAEDFKNRFCLLVY